MNTDQPTPKRIHKQDISKNAVLMFRLRKLFENFTNEGGEKMELELRERSGRGEILAPTIESAWTRLAFMLDEARMNKDAA